MEQLKTFEDACKIEGLDPEKVIPDFSSYPKQHRKSMEAHAKIVIIVAAANRLDNDGKTWIPDYSNADEPKYEIWWLYDFGKKGVPSGFRFYDRAYWSTYSAVGSRLCLKTWKTAKYIAKQFEALYNDYLL